MMCMYNDHPILDQHDQGSGNNNNDTFSQLKSYKMKHDMYVCIFYLQNCKHFE